MTLTFPMSPHLLWAVWWWPAHITTSSGCSIAATDGTWHWRRPVKTASPCRSWSPARCAQAANAKRMKSAWIVWTSIRRSCTLPGIPRTTSLRWQRPTTSTYSRIKWTNCRVSLSHLARVMSFVTTRSLTASSRAICGGNADNQHLCPALLSDQTRCGQRRTCFCPSSVCLWQSDACLVVKWCCANFFFFIIFFFSFANPPALYFSNVGETSLISLHFWIQTHLFL